jgi:ABC-2 type transport system permease protein
MPVALQYLTYLDPLRFYLVIIRDTFLKGSEARVLAPQIFGLVVLATMMLSISGRYFHKSLD